ncbi:MAG: hypothetical protein AAB403_04140 [Planctomycetota bacterium]
MSQFEVVMLLITILACWVLLPLAPAVLIYWLFPKTPLTVSGPLAGLTLNTGGAFGAYLVIFLLIIPRVQDSYHAAVHEQHQAWIIRGQFQTVTRSGEEWNPGGEFFSKIGMRTEPRISSFSERFTIHIPEVEGDIPMIYLDIGQGYSVPIQVQKKAPFTRKIIELDKPIILKQQIRDESRDDRLITQSAK